MSYQKTTQAMIVPGTTLNPLQGTERIALYDASGNPITLPQAADTASSVLMTGYTAHAVGNVAAGDTVDVAIAKLEARIAVLEAP